MTETTTYRVWNDELPPPEDERETESDRAGRAVADCEVDPGAIFSVRDSEFEIDGPFGEDDRPVEDPDGATVG